MPGFETLTVALIAWIALVMIVSGIVQGALGLGFPTIATPLIALVTDIRTAIILVLLPCIATIVIALFRSGAVKEALAQFWMMPLYMIGGAAVGTRIFIAFPQFPYALLLAAMIVVYLNLDRFGGGEWRVVKRHRHAFGAMFGVAAGLTEGTANVASPFLIVYYLAIAVQPALFVQAMNMCFLVGKTTQFATLASAGGVTALQWGMTLPLAVVAGAGAWYGVKIRGRIDAASYRRWVRGALFVIAALLIGEYGYSRWIS
ncbi:MAG TPA: sulfite exporter TauE/SafE family protein [Burkholderiales bacterium]|nr:sulfite exporter TauE/SafE family protein [Burkholderiales bacterium]